MPEKDKNAPKVSGATLPEDRVPGTQYPPASNQLSDDEVAAQEAADPQVQVEKERAEKVAKLDEASADVLAAAAESGDAGVQNLLGHRAVAQQNGDLDAIKAIDKKLGDLLNK